MDTVSQYLRSDEADQRIAWIREHLGHREDPSGIWTVEKYQWSPRVRLNVRFDYPEDQTLYLLRWPS